MSMEIADEACGFFEKARHDLNHWLPPFGLSGGGDPSGKRTGQGPVDGLGPLDRF